MPEVIEAGYVCDCCVQTVAYAQECPCTEDHPFTPKGYWVVGFQHDYFDTWDCYGCDRPRVFGTRYFVERLK